MPSKINLMKNLIEWLRVWCISVGKAWQLAYDVTTSAVRMTDAAAQLPFSFVFSPGPQPMGWCHPYAGWFLPL